ncbi:hypothetical protein, partial [Bacillus pumilus]|uniref:hypothetical protein n=1 Tax=Bacillus pumilus TaxID=1408 RepID=UPI001C92E358
TPYTPKAHHSHHPSIPTTSKKPPLIPPLPSSQTPKIIFILPLSLLFSHHFYITPLLHTIPPSYLQ